MPVPSEFHYCLAKTAVFLIQRSTNSCCQTPTIGHTFLVAGNRTWNDLLVDVTSAHLQKTTKSASVSTLISWPSFYRAMHFSAKRGIAIACRLSVCPSVCL